MKHSKHLSPKEKIRLLVENGLYEEQQGNVARARQIFESLTTQVAPGLLQAVIARVDFEKRQGSKEAVNETFSIALQRAIDRQDRTLVAFLSCRYAQYLVTDAKDAKKAD